MNIKVFFMPIVAFMINLNMFAMKPYTAFLSAEGDTSESIYGKAMPDSETSMAVFPEFTQTFRGRPGISCEPTFVFFGYEFYPRTIEEFTSDPVEKIAITLQWSRARRESPSFNPHWEMPSEAALVTALKNLLHPAPAIMDPALDYEALKKCFLRETGDMLNDSAELGYITLSELLLAEGVSIDYTGASRETPLMGAVRSKSLALVKLFLRKYKANTTMKDCYGQTALALAKADGLKEIAEEIEHSEIHDDAGPA